MSIDPQDLNALLAHAEERGIHVCVGDVKLQVRLSSASKVVAPSNQMAELGRAMMIKLVEAARSDAKDQF